MSKINTFTVKALQDNLLHGLGANVIINSKPQNIIITMGSVNCPYRPAMSQFYVNELPRLFHANPSLCFKTITADSCELSIIQSNGDSKNVELSKNTSVLFKNMMKYLDASEATKDGILNMKTQI